MKLRIWRPAEDHNLAREPISLNSVFQYQTASRNSVSLD